MTTDPFAAAGYGAKAVGFGRKAAIVVVDFQLGFTDGESPMARSPYIDAAVDRASVVLAEARALGVPVIHTVVEYANEAELGYWKPSGLVDFTPGSDAATVDPRVLGEGDAVVVKRFPSAFFGTDVASMLRYLDVDTVVLMGCVTSGCIRASTIDAFSNGFRTILADDCCGDHDPDAHASNMRDVGRRYADVLQSADVLTALHAMA
ncbi:isochorismatase family protein [Agrococcus jejuensis]|uniref:isochorismatase family protein n=1 Tax=Agrococcus jejuensis TaxID=399736 RepID=UPI0011A21FF5|nr:isochorismatase family protein [Agrococcus jejuensis]